MPHRFQSPFGDYFVGNTEEDLDDLIRWFKVSVPFRGLFRRKHRQTTPNQITKSLFQSPFGDYFVGNQIKIFAAQNDMNMFQSPFGDYFVGNLTSNALKLKTIKESFSPLSGIISSETKPFLPLFSTVGPVSVPFRGLFRRKQKRYSKLKINK